MTSFDFLEEKNPELKQHLIDFCNYVKCEPSKASAIFGDILICFLTAVCADNCISFDRARNATLIAMLGETFKCGIIGVDEKAVLDEMRQLAFSTHTDKVKPMYTTSNLIRVLNDFCGVLSKYYDREDVLPDADSFKIGNLTPKRILMDGLLKASYDRIYLCEDEKEKRFYAVAQYINTPGDFSESFAILRLMDPKRFWRGVKKLDYVLYYTTIAQESGNDMIFLAAETEKDFLVLHENYVLALPLKDRMEIALQMAGLIASVHKVKPMVATGGITMENFLFHREKNRKIILCLNAFVEHLGREPFCAEALKRGYKNMMQPQDVKDLVGLIRICLPEAEVFSEGSAEEYEEMKASSVLKDLQRECKRLKKEWKKEGKK